MAIKASKWLKLFQDFIGDIRISSKESTSQDERGAKLELWESQRRFIQEVGSGLDQDIHKFYCLKSRQLGVTTVSLAIDVFWMALHPNIIGCLVTDTEKNREANRMLLEKYVESFPDGYFGDTFKIVRSNRQMLQFSNGARLDLLVAGQRQRHVMGRRRRLRFRTSDGGRGLRLCGRFEVAGRRVCANEPEPAVHL